jgi:hypothetical protein
MRIAFVYITILLSFSCVDENFQDTFNNSVVHPEYSIPAGSVSFNINDEFTDKPSYDTVGPYGKIYYENKPYPLYVLDYFRHDEGNLNLSSKGDSRENIEEVTFHVVFKNSFPTDVYTQIILTNNSGGIIDSLFREPQNNGPLKITGGETDANGIVQKESVTVVDIPFNKNRIEDLQNVDLYQFKTHIRTIKQGMASVHFFETSKLEVTLGVRIKLKLKGDQL